LGGNGRWWFSHEVKMTDGVSGVARPVSLETGFGG
jgi:hypothetical protein